MSHCDFQTVSQHGLKVHIKRKHISTNNEKYPRKCELCDQQFENNKEMKKHMKTHSYKQANFRCEDCDFVGTNKCTIEVHIGKVDSDHFECGMCEFIAESLDTLEMHLFTCQSYECNLCNSRERNLKDIKDHIEKEHEKIGASIQHMKMDRTNYNEVTLKSYWCDDM